MNPADAPELPDAARAALVDLVTALGLESQATHWLRVSPGPDGLLVTAEVTVGRTDRQLLMWRAPFIDRAT